MPGAESAEQRNAFPPEFCKRLPGGLVFELLTGTEKKERLKFSAFIHKMYLSGEDFRFRGRLTRKQHRRRDSHPFSWEDVSIYFCTWVLHDIITETSNNRDHTPPRVTAVFRTIWVTCASKAGSSSSIGARTRRHWASRDSDSC